MRTVQLQCDRCAQPGASVLDRLCEQCRLAARASAAPPQSVKYDGGKSRLDLLPARALVAVGHVLAYGAKKYAADAWQGVPDAQLRYRAAALRHFMAMLDGESYDEESGLLHVAHLAANALFLCWFELGERSVSK